MPATWRLDRQRSLAARQQRQPGSQMDTCLSGSSGAGFTRFRSVEAGARHPTQSANVCQHRSPFWPADVHSKVAILKSRRVRPIHPWARSMIRIDSIWLATEPMDMRAGRTGAATDAAGERDIRAVAA